MEDLPVRLIGKVQIPAPDGAVGGHTIRFLLCLRQIQKAEYLITCRHAVHSDMEKGAEEPHGDEEIRREQDDEQAAGECDVSCRKLCGCQYYAESRAAVGDQVHNSDGVKLHGQHLHGDAAELLGFGIHLFLLETVRLIDFQRGEALQVFQEGVS